MAAGAADRGRRLLARRRRSHGSHPAVDIELGSTNQRGEVTAPGAATILLPSREHGPVQLPAPVGGATNLVDATDAAIAHFSRR